MMTEAEIAWLAGLFEGEGTCYRGVSKGTVYWQLNIRMTDEDVIRKAHAVSGFGRFRKIPNLYQRATKPLFWWGVTSRLELRELLPLLLPHMGERRAARFRECLEWANAEPPSPGPTRGTPWSEARRAAEDAKRGEPSPARLRARAADARYRAKKAAATAELTS